MSLCFFCYANADPAAAKMKVNAEAAIIAELAKLVPGIVAAHMMYQSGIAGFLAAAV